MSAAKATCSAHGGTPSVQGIEVSGTNFRLGLLLWQFAVIKQNKSDQRKAQRPEVAGNGGHAALG
jgi:hypothetical protein